MEENLKFSFARLDNHNYQNWKFRVKMILIREGIWSVIEDELPTEQNAEWKRKDEKAQATISLSIDDNQIVHICKCANAKEMWDELQKIHERNNLSNKLYLLRKLYQSKLEEKTMSEYIKNILELVERLRGIGETIKDFHVAALLLGGLPDTYSTLVTALDARPDDELTLEYVKGKLIDEFNRKKENSSEVALNTNKFKNFNRNKEKRECNYCHRKGHLKKDCYFLRKDSKKNQAQVATEEGESESHLDYCFNVKGSGNKSDWYIDSGATSHMSNDVKYFLNLENVNLDKIMVANGQFMKIKGKGDIVLKHEVAGTVRNLKFTDALYVPELENNLLSVSKITKAGYNMVFDENKCYIEKNKCLVFSGNYKNGLYKVDIYNENVNLLKMSCIKESCIHTWHRRLGHRNVENIKALIKNNLATGLNIFDCGNIKQCVSCIEGKLTRKPFPQISLPKTKNVLDLIHSDVCGPMRTDTVGGKKYFLTFTDDFSRFTTVYLLTSKDEVFLKIKEFFAELKNNFGRYPKIIRTDNGGEYTGGNVQSLLKKLGIKFQASVPYCPEQNGVSERKNRTLIESARCMLLDSKLPHKYWGEAVITANYISNRLPTKSKEKTPYEFWTGSKPDLSHLITFGSQAFIYVPKEKRSKLDKKTKEGIMMGYSETSKGYRILDRETDKIVISRTIKFNEFLNQPFQDIKCESKNEPIFTVDTEFKDTLENPTKETIEDENSNKEEDEEETIDNSSEEEDEKKQSGLTDEDQSLETLNDEGEKEVVTRSGRISKRGHLEDYVTYNVFETNYFNQSETGDPVSVSEALSRADRQKWREAMEREYKSLLENEAWILVDRPPDKSIVKNKWVFCVKKVSNGEVRYKARLVAKGFSQKFGIDYLETFSPVVRNSTIRILFALSVELKLNIDHLDVETAFLNGEIDQEIYMNQPEGFISESNENKVCLLKKAIYGLKQSSRIWNLKVKKLLLELDFQQSSYEPCIFFKNVNKNIIIVAIYVDDFLICSNCTILKTNLKEELSKQFKIKDLGPVKYFLGLNIEQNKENNIIKVNQKEYILELLDKFKLSDAKTVYTPIEVSLKLKPSNDQPNVPYQNLIGSLMYLCVHTRPDISYSISYLSQFNTSFSLEHWKHAKRVLKYLKGSIDQALIFCKSENSILGYVDADFSNDVNDRKSYSGYVFKMSNAAISWESRKQSCVALSSTEAEYIAITEATKEGVFISGFLNEILKHNEPLVIFNDSQSAQKLIRNPIYHSRTKHIDTKYHYIREIVDKGIIVIEYLPTDKMVADILTKGLHSPKHKFCVETLGIKKSLD